MRRVMRRAFAAGTLALLLAASAATAAAPKGPRLAAARVTRMTAHRLRIELVTVGPHGGRPLRLAGGGPRSRPWPNYFFSSFSWSPGGERIAFSGIVGAHKGDNHELRVKLFTVRAGREASAAPASGPSTY